MDGSIEVPQTCEPAKNLLIGVPSYTGKPAMEVLSSVLNSRFKDWPGIHPEFKICMMGVYRDPYIDRVRNSIVTTFLENPDFTDLLFLDDDVGFDPTAIAKIASARKPLVGGCYPKCTDDLTVQFPMDFIQGKEIVAQDGLIEVAMIPTGFMRINRVVFDWMPYVPYECYGKQQKGYFKTQIANNMYLGEDVIFCHMWRALGGKVWVCPDITFTHVKGRNYEGNLHNWLMENCNGKEASGVQGGAEENRGGRVLEGGGGCDFGRQDEKCFEEGKDEESKVEEGKVVEYCEYEDFVEIERF